MEKFADRLASVLNCVVHLKIQCEYIGTKYAGFQTQVGQRTIQNELEKAISRYFATPVKVVGSGRTDAGVHAVGQVVSCLCPREDVKIYQFLLGVNSYLPSDIAVTSAEVLPKFNARSDAKAKTYVYKCYVSSTRHPSLDVDHWQLYKPVDLERLRTQAQILVGTHDFTSFCAELRDKSPIRTIYSLDIQSPTPDTIYFVIRGNGFLHNMVRIIVGTLLEKSNVQAVLDARDRRKAGKTAPAKGLNLASVEY